MYLRIGHRRNINLGEVVLGLDQIKFALVGVVVVADILVADVDLGSDFFVQDFFHGEGTAQVAAEILERNLLVSELLVELFLGVGRLDLVHLAVDFLVGGEEAEFLGTMHEDFVIDELAQNAEAKAGGLLAHGSLRLLLLGAGGLVRIIFFHVGAKNFAAIDSRHHVGTALLGLAGGQEHQCGSGAACERAPEQHRVEFQAKIPLCGSAIRKTECHLTAEPDGAGAGFASLCTGGWTPAWMSARSSTVRSSAMGRAPSISSPFTNRVGVAFTPTASPS